MFDVEKLDIQIEITEHRNSETGEVVRLFADFRNGENATDLTGANVPSVSLARVPDHCFFRLDELDNHRNHKPAFANWPNLVVYVDRVRAAIGEACNGWVLESPFGATAASPASTGGPEMLTAGPGAVTVTSA